MKYLLTFICLLFFTCYLSGQSPIPTPEKMHRTEGDFYINQNRPVTIYAEDTTKPCLELLRTQVLKDRMMQVSDKNNNADIRFVTDLSLSPEAYKLRISPHQMEIKAADNGGFTYAIQTLRQWMKMEKTRLIFPCVDIQDEPRVKWRCFLLDSGRQFQKVSTIKKYIDMASMLKMNRFHWHLTEGLGWRIEIKRYPALTGKGAFVGKGPEQQGFYSQAEVRDIVKYAAERNITIVPEIDMPGHAEAALAAYPELGCFGTPVAVPETGFTSNIFCAGKENTIRFLKNVLDEVCELFPSTYIHLGGDEAPKGNWDKCPDCQQLILKEKLRDSHDLQLWFSSEMANYLKAKGRKVIFWGDVVYKDGHPLPDNVAIQWWNWRGHKDLALNNAIRHGHPVICSTNYYTYLNFPVTPWKGYNDERTFDLKDIYLHNPSYKTEDNPLILGMSCALWTDYGVTENMIDRRLFPRILALAEQMWHKGKLDSFDIFYDNILQKRSWFEEQGFRFGPALKENIDNDYQWD